MMDWMGQQYIDFFKKKNKRLVNNVKRKSNKKQHTHTYTQTIQDESTNICSNILLMSLIKKNSKVSICLKLKTLLNKKVTLNSLTPEIICGPVLLAYNKNSGCFQEGGWPSRCSVQPVFSSGASGWTAEQSLWSRLCRGSPIPLEGSPCCEFMKPHAACDSHNPHLVGFRQTSQIFLHAGPKRAS